MVAILGLVASVGLAGCGPLPLTRPGQTPNPTPTPGPSFDEERTGFDGRVVDQDGEPIAGVHLTLVLPGRRGTAATTDRGTFFGRGVIGDIQITAELDGYETAEETVTVRPNRIAEVEIVLRAEDG
jgi:hypothetical protein